MSELQFDLTPDNILRRNDGSFVVKIIGGDLNGQEYQTTPDYNRELWLSICVVLELDPETQEEHYRAYLG